MTAIAWAIIFLSVCISDSFYVMKFGMKNEASASMKVVEAISLTMTVICTIVELIKK